MINSFKKTRGSAVRACVACYCLTLLLGGCSVTSMTVPPGGAVSLANDGKGRWIMLPVLNYSETPNAGEKAESIVGALLEVHGLRTLGRYPSPEGEEVLELNEQKRYEQALSWARKKGFAYGVTGSVDEWRYKSGVEGEPAVGLSLRIVEIPSEKVLWSAVGARTGWGRDSVSGTAQRLIEDLLDEFETKTSR